MHRPTLPQKKGGLSKKSHSVRVGILTGYCQVMAETFGSKEHQQYIKHTLTSLGHHEDAGLQVSTWRLASISLNSRKTSCLSGWGNNEQQRSFSQFTQITVYQNQLSTKSVSQRCFIFRFPFYYIMQKVVCVPSKKLCHHSFQYSFERHVIQMLLITSHFAYN